jgi:hypothetical protein
MAWALVVMSWYAQGETNDFDVSLLENSALFARFSREDIDKKVKGVMADMSTDREKCKQVVGELLALRPEEPTLLLAQTYLGSGSKLTKIEFFMKDHSRFLALEQWKVEDELLSFALFADPTTKYKALKFDKFLHSSTLMAEAEDVDIEKRRLMPLIKNPTARGVVQDFIKMREQGCDALKDFITGVYREIAKSKLDLDDHTSPSLQSLDNTVIIDNDGKLKALMKICNSKACRQISPVQKEFSRCASILKEHEDKLNADMKPVIDPSKLDETKAAGDAPETPMNTDTPVASVVDGANAATNASGVGENPEASSSKGTGNASGTQATAKAPAKAQLSRLRFETCQEGNLVKISWPTGENAIYDGRQATIVKKRKSDVTVQLLDETVQLKRPYKQISRAEATGGAIVPAAGKKPTSPAVGNKPTSISKVGLDQLFGVRGI